MRHCASARCHLHEKHIKSSVGNESSIFCPKSCGLILKNNDNTALSKRSTPVYDADSPVAQREQARNANIRLRYEKRERQKSFCTLT